MKTAVLVLALLASALSIASARPFSRGTALKQLLQELMQEQRAAEIERDREYTEQRA